VSKKQSKKLAKQLYSLWKRLMKPRKLWNHFNPTEVQQRLQQRQREVQQRQRQREVQQRQQQRQQQQEEVQQRQQQGEVQQQLVMMKAVTKAANSIRMKRLLLIKETVFFRGQSVASICYIRTLKKR
jgi:hypothetical protein